MRLPGVEQAIIDPAKVRDYLLSPEHPVGRAKARVFAALGFRQAAWLALHEALLVHAREGAAEPVEAGPHGKKYRVRGILRGPGDRSGAVVAVWIVLPGEAAPRFVTAYPE